MQQQFTIWSPEEWLADFTRRGCDWDWAWTRLWFYVYHQWEIAYEDLDNFQEALRMMATNAKERREVEKGIELVWSEWRNSKK